MTHQNAQLSIKALNTLPPVLTPPDSTGKSVGSWVGAGEEDPGVDGARNERVDEPSVDIVQGTSTRSTFERLQATDGRMLKSNSIGLSNGAPRCFAADDAVAVARGPENPRNGTPYPTTVSFLLFFPRSFLSYSFNGALGCDSMISDRNFLSPPPPELDVRAPAQDTPRHSLDERPTIAGSERLPTGPTACEGTVCNVHPSNVDVPDPEDAEDARDSTPTQQR